VQGDPPPSTPPDPATLQGLGSDGWAVLLSAVRTVLVRDAHLDDAELAGFREAPTSRLVGGRLREGLVRRLGVDATLWTEVAEVMGQRPELPDDLVAVVARVADDGPSGGGAAADPSIDATASGTSGGPTGDGGSSARARETARVAKQRVREAREERDAWRRRAEGAEARADGLLADLQQVREEAEALRAGLADARATIEAAEVDRDRAVERERRRRGSEIAALETALAELRRDEEHRRSEIRRQADAKRQAELEAERSAVDARRRATEDQPPRVVPGRPSRLPRGVEPGTTEAARELLHQGRRLLVDGYNVTKQHRGQLDLETQRNWLVQQVGVLARRRGVVPTIVFDGQTSSGSRPPAALRDVRVLFSDAGVTADDEVVMAVVATDDPVVVVTDDRELAARVRVHGADVVGTRSFLGVLS
jgi:hypothetical protein